MSIRIYDFVTGIETSTNPTPTLASADEDVPSYGQIQDEFASVAALDAAVKGLKWKDPVRAISTTDITLSAPQTIDGVSVIAGDRVLVAGQSTGANNGIYLVAAGAWTRATDFDSSSEVLQASVFVEEGTSYADSGWVCTTNAPITLGVTSLAFVQFSGNAIILAGAGLLKTGSTIDAVAGDNSLTMNADDMVVKRNTTAAVGNIIVTATGITSDTDGSTLETASNKLQIKAGGVSNTQVNASAAIAYSKLAALTINKALVSDASGFVSASGTSSTELGYVTGVTSAIQTQLGTKFDTAGAGLTSTGTTVDVVAGDNSITSNTNDIVVKRNTVAGVGNIIVTATGVTTDTDGSTIETSSNKIQVKSGGISNTQIGASAAIDYSKLATMTTGQALIGNAGVPTATTLGGDVTVGATGTVTIANDAVTNAKLANMAAHTFKGNNTAGSTDPIDLTATQLTAELNQFTTTLQGVVPGSGGGTTNFLRADGTWAAAGGSSTITVKEEGTNVNTNFTALNFIGTAITATDAGGGVANITVSPAGAVYAPTPVTNSSSGNYSMAATADNTLLIHTATAHATYQLPTPSTSSPKIFYFVNTVGNLASSAKVQPASGHTIRCGNMAVEYPGYISVDRRGAMVSVTALDSTTWLMVDIVSQQHGRNGTIGQNKEVDLVSRDTWVNKANLTTALYYNSTFSLNGSLYSIGGSTTSGNGNTVSYNYQYNDSTNAWATKTNRTNSASYSYGGILNSFGYSYGGTSTGAGGLAISNVYRYNDSADTWSARANLSIAKTRPSASMMNGYGYVVGGENSGGTIVSTNERYNDNLDSYSTMTAYPVIISLLPLSDLNGYIYGAGGNGGSDVSSVYQYNDSSNAWIQKANYAFSASRGSPSNYNGKLLVGGGAGPISSAAYYNDSTNTWTTATNMNSAASGSWGNNGLSGFAYVTAGDGLSTVQQYN